MYLFDTNIFLEFLLGQQEAQACKQALGSLEEERQGWVTSFSLHAVEVIMDRMAHRHALEKFLIDLTRDRYLSRYDTTVEEEADVARLASNLSLDFDDTLQYYVARKKGLTLVTLDRDFRKVGGITVSSPHELVD